MEAYTVGLVNMWHYMAYTDKMGAATDVSEGYDTRCAGGISSIVYDSETGKSFYCTSAPPLPRQKAWFRLATTLENTPLTV